MVTDLTARWWRNSVIYQVYVRSFADSDGDGTGDINGIRSRLPYLADLGVDGLWVNPWYTSPLHDGGYDVADYREINPIYGTLQDARDLIREAHAADIKVIVDLVPNHTSAQHEWFQEAIQSPPNHPSRNRYHIRPGKGTDGSEPPTNWLSVFGGPAWERLPDGEWYLHLFDHTQPDLNWANPEVQDEFRDIFRFWLALGADGFRVDVAHGLAKDMSFPDIPTETEELLVTAKLRNHPFWDRDDVHTYIRQWREVLDASPNNSMMVAEAWVAPERVHLYLRPDEYHQSFAFNFLESSWNPEELTTSIQKALDDAGSVGAVPTWALSNHDVVRHATRYGLPEGVEWRKWLLEGPHDLLDADLGQRRARAAIMLMLALPGSAYLYQGEELGLPEVWDLPEEVLDDPVWEQSGHTTKGRDGCRVPLPWTANGPSFGFGAGPPWLPQPAYFGNLSAANQALDPESMLQLYRSALRLRRALVPASDEIEWLVPHHPKVVAFRRAGGLQCWVNFSRGEIALPDEATVQLMSDPAETDTGKLPPDACVWFN
ncbi:MAG: glycoside hydrolase family 13 protein [Acidimicrobiales bacterium]|nr:glycoside hydrolase family 13 protein [Acidimicrobiales bacterium]